jgi:hypothetical protein
MIYLDFRDMPLSSLGNDNIKYSFFEYDPSSSINVYSTISQDQNSSTALPKELTC